MLSCKTHTQCSFQVTSRCASSCYIKCTVGTWISSCWLVSGCKVCTFLVFCWLICLCEQTIAYATAQTAEIFHQSFMYPTTWSIWSIWTMKTLNLSTLLAFQHYSLACKIQFLKTCPKKFIRFPSEWIINLLQGNLSGVKRRHVVKYRDEIHELSLKITTWKQRRSLLSSEKGLLLIKTISPFVNNHLSWDGTVCSSTSFCAQQQQQPNLCHKIRNTQIQTWANSHVPQRYVKKRN